jgi:hypothetical protein
MLMKSFTEQVSLAVMQLTYFKDTWFESQTGNRISYQKWRFSTFSLFYNMSSSAFRYATMSFLCRQQGSPLAWRLGKELTPPNS